MDTKNPVDMYCYGTIPIYNQAYQMLAGKNDIDTILVNTDTIVRNVIAQHGPEEMKLVKQDEKRLSESFRRLGDMAVQELGTLLYDLASLLNRDSPVSLNILSYRYPYHRMIPKDHLRIKEDLLDVMVRQHINQKIGTTATTAEYKNVKLLDVYDESDNILKGLIQYVSNLNNQHNVLMISHHPIDYHVAPACNSWRVIKSYTGAVWTYDELGQNVLKQNLPYLKHLHILLGDKTDLKPTLPKKERDKLVQISQDESWYLLPEDKIEERLRQLSYLTPYTF